jgi:hypothetical protein
MTSKTDLEKGALQTALCLANPDKLLYNTLFETSCTYLRELR